MAPPAGTQHLVHINGEYAWSPCSLRDILVAGGDGECLLELFEAMRAEDGAWLGTVTDRRVAHCPAGLDTALDSLAKALVFPRKIAWNGAFHPDRIRMEGSAPAIRWTRLSATRLQGEGASAQGQGPASAAGIGVVDEARLMSPRLVKIDLALRIRGTGAAQAMIDALAWANAMSRSPWISGAASPRRGPCSAGAWRPWPAKGLRPPRAGGRARGHSPRKAQASRPSDRPARRAAGFSAQKRGRSFGHHGAPLAAFAAKNH